MSITHTFPLWQGECPFPSADAIPVLPSDAVEYRTAHRAEQPYTFAIGAALAVFRGTLHCSWATNPDGEAENQGTEFVVERTSADGGRTWSDVRVLAPQLTGGAFHSHGSYFEHDGRLLFFAKRGPWQGPAVAFELSADGTGWTLLGPVTAENEPFWPMDAPTPLPGGRLAMGGLSGDDGKTGAVAFASGNDPLAWSVTTLPIPEKPGVQETTLLASGEELLAISRCMRDTTGGAHICRSTDGGGTWAYEGPGNIPILPSKPYAGRLQDSRPYLVCNLHPEPGGNPRRSHICLLTGPEGTLHFDRAWLLRDPVPPPARFSGPQHNPQWGYPYAVERKGELLIAYHSAKEDIELTAVRVDTLTR